MMKIINSSEFEKDNIFGQGLPNVNYAKYFIGQSYLNLLTEPTKSSLLIANVTFEPGCRNNWHIHLASKGGRANSIMYSWQRLVSKIWGQANKFRT